MQAVSKLPEDKHIHQLCVHSLSTGHFREAVSGVRCPLPWLYSDANADIVHLAGRFRSGFKVELDPRYKTDTEQVGLGCMPDVYLCMIALGFSSDKMHMAHTGNLLDILLLHWNYHSAICSFPPLSTELIKTCEKSSRSASLYPHGCSWDVNRWPVANDCQRHKDTAVFGQLGPMCLH